MNVDEAIKLLVNATYSDDWQGNEELTTAHNMSIKALEQEPCENTVSRKLKIGDEIYIRANVNEIRKDYIICENAGGYFGTVLEEIKSSVTPTQEPILDKIREEIEKQEKWLWQAGINPYNVDIAFSSIKSALAESEKKKI